MTPDQRFSLIISGIGLIFVILTGMLGLMWKSGNQWGRLTTDVKHLAESIGQIALDTNRRLEKLEDKTDRRMW